LKKKNFLKKKKESLKQNCKVLLKRGVLEVDLFLTKLLESYSRVISGVLHFAAELIRKYLAVYFLYFLQKEADNAHFLIAKLIEEFRNFESHQKSKSV